MKKCLRNDGVLAEDAVALGAAASGVDERRLGLHPNGPSPAHQQAVRGRFALPVLPHCAQDKKELITMIR